MSDCKRLWEVDAFRDGRLTAIDGDSFVRHRRLCRDCARKFADDEQLRDLGNALASPKLNPMHVRRVRGEILRRAAAGAPSRRPLAWASLVAAVLAATLSREPSFAAAVNPQPGARWSRRREGGIERVRLEEGGLVIQVRHQAVGERFVVDLPDGELEVRGTRFEIVVRAGHTASVDVFEGLVALRRFGSDEVLVGAGDSWPKALAVESLPHAADMRLVIAPRPGVERAAITAVESTDYERGMERYRARDYADAGRAFHAFTTAHPDAAEAEDATFLEATSLASSGRGDAAALVAERFLERYPASFHAKDAAILGARAARDRGDCGKVRALLSPWRAAAEPAEVIAALGTCGWE
jgi:hypothetical protein